MADPKLDEGTIQEKVDRGELLQDSDIQFLKMVFADANAVGHLVQRNAEYGALVAKLIGLYDEITRKALENEEKGSGGPRP
jgi:hypothetical protein